MAAGIHLAQRAISSCFFVLAAVGMLLAGAWFLGSPWIPWHDLLKASRAVSPEEARGAMHAFFLATLLGLPFSIVELECVEKVIEMRTPASSVVPPMFIWCTFVSPFCEKYSASS